ncbi:FAD-linked oxidase-like protein [Mycena sp. CBHHK59/15]|nr:FAD-linked oxidase-like protein [Mycena sp. CBHHK59/15]
MCGAVGGYSIARSTDVPLVPTAKSEYGTPEEFERAIEELRHTFSHDNSAVSTDPMDLAIHGESPYDHHDAMNHTVIVYPQSTEDVVKIVKIANKFRMPVVPYSGATSLEGQVGGCTGGAICVDLSRMDAILEIHETDSDLVCQPGAGWMDINETLRSKGIPLFFPIDPAPSATVGGMIGTGCSGTNAVRYGTAKGEWFLNVTVVLPTGEVIKTRRRSRKSSTGFDLTKFPVTIRLAPVLPTTVACVHFPNVGAAAEAVRQCINEAGIGAGIQCVELVDDNYMAAVNKFGSSKQKYLEKDSLFFKFQAHSGAAMKDVAKTVKAVCEKNGGTGFKLASGPAEAEAMWSDRKNALNIGLSLLPGAKGWSTDVWYESEPLPLLRRDYINSASDLAAAGITSMIAGHAGDGNFHALLLYRTNQELDVAKVVSERMVRRAIALDGTCTGEHGVGVGKKKYLVDELGPGTVALMKTIKKAVDPLGLFNPGKLYPD